MAVVYDMTWRDWLFFALALLLIYGGDIYFWWKQHGR